MPAGIAIPSVLPASPVVLWHKEVGFALASPVISGGKVFYLDDQKDKEIVHGLDARTGNELWNFELDDATKDSQSQPGPRTTPIAEGDRVYAQSCRGKLKVLNANDGKLVWQTDYVKDFGGIFIGEKGKAEGASRHGFTATPIIDGEHLIAEVGATGAGVVCFDKKTGQIIWKSQDDMAGYAPPLIATVAGTRQFIAFTAIGVIGLDPSDGKLLWRVPVKTALGRHAATPVVIGDMVLVSSHQASLMGITITKEGSSFKANTTWTAKESSINFASPVAVDHFLYGVGPTKNLICVDAQTGKQTWSKDSFFSSSGGKAYAGMIVMGSNILVLADDGQLVLIKADPAQYQEISRTQVEGTNWCNPAYAEGKLYLRDARELRCVQLMP